ncbi:hypothetical protein TTHERM_000019709 (macronuclear) [Tetrahymena thermophila SB210]|uniref:Uncharacterized protein n=1 Tax=Tetrahymena thermophila (strain SB210) TaxID=312017 RepID=W7XLJ2_TETTS|nr:hypothetical protein TTHERM_000019709 [Tetrahymena thermophila SB210]EWS76384.1 hypothetical protein TTHERM_000019709 [Tetrahymena thermophila SB210]|eukprot:XP_012651168.1 hypothetical protein TTHERM_000019709 [Tetrahymena thermophila SB210]
MSLISQYREKKHKHNQNEKEIKQNASKQIKRVMIHFQIQKYHNQKQKNLFTQDQVSNLRDYCNLLKQNLSLMLLHHQLNYNFLNIKEKIFKQLASQKEKMKKMYEKIKNKSIINKTKVEYKK